MGECGDTLVELLIAIVIIALSVSALLGALITSLTSSAEHRSLANLDTVVKGFAEAATYQLELQPNRTDTATVTSGSDSVADSSISVADQGKALTGTGIPTGTYVGTVIVGTSFLLSSSPGSQVDVNATGNGTSVTMPTLFADCASATGTNYNGSPINYVPPPGYSATVNFKSIQYWNSVTDAFDVTCSDYQLLTITATAPSGVSETISFGVRSPI
ncbi:MAG TPA: hypothetical protein DCQ30_06450 [Acidimicrobiaceae bacterium]|nr:hypothetical protein [Acidimicrobiaceae bacterium]